eukprot:440840-Prymnesium_polylepis.1
MPVLFARPGSPIHDAAGNELKTGQTVIDDMFGEGIVRGTVPLARGEGLNVLIDWLGPKDRSEPKSRGAAHLTAKYASGNGEVHVRAHTGAQYESGDLHAAQERNDEDAARLNTDRQPPQSPAA